MTSKIKVDNINKVSDDSNIINKCGTSITMGQNGDTVIIPNGVTEQIQSGGDIQVQSGGQITIAAGGTITNNGTAVGLGRTGTVDWVTTPKVTGDSPVTGESGKGYFLNTTGGVITINLPAGSAGDIISMADYAATWDSLAVTVVPNGSQKIGGNAESATLSIKGQSVTFVYVDTTQGWINTMDSTSNVRGAPPFVSATVSGACNTLVTAPDCANAKIATFVNPGTFNVTSLSPCAAQNEVSYMVVAGGGAGGTAYYAGSGGAGGFREAKSPQATGYTASPLCGYSTPGNRITVSVQGYPIQAGGGGAASPCDANAGGTGTPSIFDTIVSAGGGGGGSRDQSGPGSPSGPVGGRAGTPGGSGGGGTNSSPQRPDLGGTGNDPSTTPSQGNPGGTAGYGAAGGGAGAAGGDAPDAATIGIVGGAGVTTEISASPTAYAGGGGAGSSGTNQIPGGIGGGGTGTGNCGPTPATGGTANTGGGGGGGSSGPTGTYKLGGSGGSGMVIIRYKFQ